MSKVKAENAEVITEDSLKSNKGRRGGYQRGHVSMDKFTGNFASLSEHIYDIRHGQAVWYMKTTDTIAKYMGEEYTHRSDIQLSIEILQLPTREDPPKKRRHIQRAMYQSSVISCYRRNLGTTFKKPFINQSVRRAYSPIWDQRDDTMWSRRKDVKQYTTIKKEFMTIELLKEIKLIVLDVQSHQYLPLAVFNTLQTYIISSQDEHTSIQQ